MNPSNPGSTGGMGEPLRIPPPQTRSLGRPLRLVPLAGHEPGGATTGGGDPQRPAAVNGMAPSAASPQPPLAAATRKLERELADVQE
jgi:hypothetical protein